MPSQSQNPRTGAPPTLVYAQPLNVYEAAEWLGVSVQTVYRMLNTGRIKAVNRNHHWFISQKALADYAYGEDAEKARKGA